MAKTIIKDGSSTFHGLCDRCGCVFDYQPEDVGQDHVRSLAVVSCPTCRHSLVHFGVSGTSWPTRIAGGRCAQWFKMAVLKTVIR
jgi:hypothetical protein